MKLYTKIEQTISALDVETIPANRKRLLDTFTDYLKEKIQKEEAININFICTHNSRRSHFAQIWAQTIAAHFSLNQVVTYSGGTEATALFPKVVETLNHSGFQIEKISGNSNPIYSIKYAENQYPIIGFSKKLDDDFNPKTNFLAIMTCSQADEGCPFVPGAEKRIALPFEDPKLFDNTDQQAEKYKERSLQIATELVYVFSKIKS